MNSENHEMNSQPRQKKQGARAVALVIGLALVLMLGALYAPALLQNAPVFAAPGASAPAAPAFQADSSLVNDQEALAALYEAVAPAIVNIQVESNASPLQMPDIPGFEVPEDMPSVPQMGQGSGFIFDDQGHIVTNNHVVEGATKVLVTFNDGRWAEAEVVAADPQADLAVIKVTPPEGMAWLPLALADDSTIKVGHTVIAIGNPFGLAGTMTTGIVSALGRGFPVGSMGARYTLPDVIQTDAAINPGNSGGPLLDLAGNVVGVNFAIESPVRTNSGVGFAIPVSIVRRVVPELIKDGKFEYAYLGLQGNTITPQLADALELEDNKLGVYVSGVVPGGPAEEGGVQGGDTTVTDDAGLEFQKGGDIVVAIDDQPVRRFEDLVSYLVTKAAPGQPVVLTVIRDGAEQTFDITLAERPSQPVVASSEAPAGDINARAAIAIAEAAVEASGDLTGEITEKMAMPEERDGKAVWVVELATAGDTATVIVDAESGDVIDITVE